MKKLSKSILFAGSILCVCAALVKAQDYNSINVALDRNSTATIIPFATSALGYDAADTSDSGTTWNNIGNEGGVGLNTSLTGIIPANSAVGSYQFLYSIPLVDSASNATLITLSATMNATSVDGHGEYNNDTPSGGTGLLAQSERLYSGGDNATWTFSGLTAGAQYNVYLYGIGGGTGQGADFTLATANDAATGVFTAQTTDNSVSNIVAQNNTIWDGSGNVINGPGTDPGHAGNSAYGISWVELNAVADASGNLNFTESKAASGVDYFNGIQLQAIPEPSAFVLAGLGLIGLVTMNYRRGRISR